MLASAIVLVTAVATAAVLAFTPRIRSSRAWRATVTPLSSIMGSGFLVCAPLLAGEAGLFAPVAMAVLLLVAFAVGSMIRFNIRYAEPELEDDDEPGEHRLHRGHRQCSRSHWSRLEQRVAAPVERASHVVLAGAYAVSVTYYLQLLAAFVLDRLGMHDLIAGRVLTTVVLAGIATVGARWGLRALERVETYAVSLNLGTIAALLVGLAIHDLGLATDGRLALPRLPFDDDLSHATRVVMGLLIVVQGFETSRFLGSDHPSEERVSTMRSAQLVASAIYLAFLVLMLPLFDGRALDADVTAIIGLVAPVAVVLPTLIVVAAVGSQFSAAVADDAGCAGLTRTMLAGRLSARWGYVIIGVATIGLTWLTDVLSIISLASRAFALFYALQCAVAVITARAHPDAPHRLRTTVLGSGLAVLTLLIAGLGIPAE